MSLSSIWPYSVSLLYTAEDIGQKGSVQAAVARTASRSIALYFARPVRLFRPAKGKFRQRMPFVSDN